MTRSDRCFHPCNTPASHALPARGAVALLALFFAMTVQAQGTDPVVAPKTAGATNRPGMQHAGTQQSGMKLPLSYPRIKGAGGVLAVDARADTPSTTTVHRVLIDISDDATTPDGHNGRLDMAARALNLYAMAGVPDDKVRMAVVLYGKGTGLALSDAAYNRKFGHPNPDEKLITQLHAAGVELFVCGQALGHLGFTAADVRPEVRLALSALTKREELQAAGYGTVP